MPGALHGDRRSGNRLHERGDVLSGKYGPNKRLTKLFLEFCVGIDNYNLNDII